MATIPPIRTWVSELLTSAKMNEIGDMLEFLRDVEGGLFLGRNTSASSLGAAASNIAIPMNTADFDVDNGHDEFTNNARYTGKTPGTYLVTGVAFYGANTTGSRGAFIRKNLVTEMCYARGAPTVDGPCYQFAGIALVTLNGSSDFVELCTRHTASATLSTDTSNGGSLLFVARLAS